jgi:hypothetical protein
LLFIIKLLEKCEGKRRKEIVGEFTRIMGGLVKEFKIISAVSAIEKREDLGLSLKNIA